MTAKNVIKKIVKKIPEVKTYLLYCRLLATNPGFIKK